MATGAAAALARARREIQHHFFSEDAVRPDRAVTFEASRDIEQRQFERMQAKGIIRRSGDGRYWLDVVAYDVDLTRRYRRVKIALMVVLAGILAGVLIPLLALAGATNSLTGH